MNKLIFDTNFLVALIDKRDKFHKEAEEMFKRMEELNCEIFIFECVIDEALNVFSRRCSEQKREEEFENILDRTLSLIREINIIWVYDKVKDFYEEIIKRIRNTKGHLNFHDVLIILSANYFNIPYIVSFDSDFNNVEGLVRIKDKEDLEGG